MVRWSANEEDRTSRGASVENWWVSQNLPSLAQESLAVFPGSGPDRTAITLIRGVSGLRCLNYILGVGKGSSPEVIEIRV